MTLYSDIASPKATTQREQAREDQVKNNAGGYVFALDDWKRLDRFLILGSEGGTYYAGERKLTLENIAAVRLCLAKDGPRVVARAAEISHEGRAPKNDAAIFVLALATVSKDPATRKAAREAIGRVCRIGTHLFHFVEDVERLAEAQHRWGRGLRRGIARWYTQRTPEQVALQAIKYPSRDGWSHRDVLRLAHPVPPSVAHAAAFRWIVDGSLTDAVVPMSAPSPPVETKDMQAPPVQVGESLAASFFDANVAPRHDGASNPVTGMSLEPRRGRRSLPAEALPAFIRASSHALPAHAARGVRISGPLRIGSVS